MKNNLIFVIASILGCVSCTTSLLDIVQKTEHASFVIYMYDEFGSPNGSGSGFFIEEEGIGITNYHVLNKSVKAIIKTSDEAEYEIDSVLYASSQKDLLVFSIKNEQQKKFSTLKIAKSNPLKGTRVFCISSPRGYESSVSDGIISSYRQNNEIVQITAPVSPGSSGSPIMDESGKVFAVTSFKRNDAENLNFGVVINKEVIAQLDKDEFKKNNPKFNRKNFIVLNIPDERKSTMVLNAIELSNTVTTLYMTYTNLQLLSGESHLWCKFGEKFFIEDKETQQKYYLTSSTLSTSKKEAESIKLTKSIRFKVFFPAIKKDLKNIDVIWEREIPSFTSLTARFDSFTDIDLEHYKKPLSIDKNRYLRDYALWSATKNGNFAESLQQLQSVINVNPSDALTLNALGVISYQMDNNSDALDYFTEAIDKNPIDVLGYLNRARVYSFQKRYDNAIKDISSAINLVPDQPDYYYYRARAYWSTDEYAKAKADLDKGLASGDDFKEDPHFYEFRAYVNIKLNNLADAQNDVRLAYKYSKDTEMDERLKKLYDKL
ncbi:MAG: serine protease [Bacteroidales bacterium]|jgi:serine protease Do|nr:serine protease [Bacteroidales bacterium]